MLTPTRLLRALCVVLALAATGSAVRAQAPANPQEEAEHQALRDLRAVYEQAIRENRVELLQPHLHPEFSGVMVTGRQVTSFDEVRQYWQDIRGLIGEGGRYTTTVKPEWSTIVGDVALARGTSDDVVVTGDGDEFRFQSFWTAVLQKHEGRWKIRRMQGTMDPIGNPFVREFAQRAVTRAALGAGLLGLFAGVAVMLFVRRRRTA